MNRRGLLRQPNLVGEVFLRRIYAMLGLLSTLAQLGALHAAQTAATPRPGGLGLPLASAGFSVALSVLALMRPVPIRVFHGVVLGTAFLWVMIVPLFTGLAADQPTRSMGVVILTLLAYAWLPHVQASLLAVTSCAALLWSAWRNPQDFALALLTCFTVMIAAFVSAYGRQVRLERAHRQHWQRQAFSDPVTQLSNRRGAQLLLNDLAEQDGLYSLILLDIDHFKTVNDRYGHAKGDDVLRRVAMTLDTLTPRQGVAARWGGEEFLIVIPELPLHDTRHLAQSINSAIRNARWPGLPRITLSAGVATSVEQAPGDALALLNLADQRLYTAKQNGRDQVQ